MRAMLLAVAVFGLAVTAGGQTRPPAQTVRISAAQVEIAGGLVHYRRNVQMTVGAVTLTADEADLPITRGNPDGSQAPIQIRGGVQVAFDPAIPILIQ